MSLNKLKAYYMNTTASIKLKETISRIDGAYAPSTIRAYRANFEKFIDYCSENHKEALPAKDESVANYIQHLTRLGLKSASIRIAIAAVATIHKLNGLDDPAQKPTVKIEMRRMHRLLGRANHQAYGITSTLLEKLANTTNDSTIGLRNKALLMIAYDTMCRRSELVSLRIQDIRYLESNEVVTCSIILRKSKTDQNAIGKHLHLSARTANALKAWLSKINESHGSIFRGVTASGKITSGLSEGQINRIYKGLARTAKIDQEVINNISGHSIRVGAAQDLVHKGVSLPILMSKGRWTKPETAMRYVEHINHFGEYASANPIQEFRRI